MLGSGAVIVIDDRCCMVQLGLRVAQFYMHESCGKCTPCREGTRWMVQLLRKIEDGEATQGELDVLLDVCDRILGNCLCPLGDAAAMPIASYVAKFREEYQRHIDEGGCPFGGESSLEDVLAPVDQHHAHLRGRSRCRPGHELARASHPGAPSPPPASEPNAENAPVHALVTRSPMSAAELVTVTIDGHEIQVPKGQGMVETAASAGIEIPVFCYEPRLGAPVGACRMCLCEVEGMPKLQAACTLTAQDGMVLKTAQTSEQAAQGQDAVLEFILLNHPLDCPDCDKGGECPLQDLTFRYGPGSTRMHFPKRTFDKPIPISPLIALDRERCILCYRCTRFSENVSEDGQLVAVNRGAQSIIATFEDEPYRAHFSGNVVELCPVGALTSTTYRFRARPWEIQNVPTVCGLCPGGCNVWATTREGQGRADPLPQPPRGGRGLDLRQGPLRLRPSARARPHHARRSCACGAAGSRSPRTRPRSTPPRPGSARPGSSVVVAFSGGETVEQATRARAASSARARRATRRSCPTTGIRGSTPSARRSRPSATPRSASSSATSPWSSAPRSSTSGCAPRAAPAAR